MKMFLVYVDGELLPVWERETGRPIVEYEIWTEHSEAVAHLAEKYTDFIYMEMGFEEMFPGINT